ncbi:MAG: enoyl-CoA hydratase/isomerase family protein [Actinomycetota bacterium]|jgi:enoyl-CoA hydratase/carnithine racemase|nr:enoyl-CoA hydratase/isomerase family protein [Actinomycetota bacterium]
MANELVLLERDGPRAEIVLNRPHRRNAIVPELVESLIDVVGQLAGDISVAAVLLRGAGGTFCSGMDLKEFAATSDSEAARGFPARWATLHRALATLPVPLVGALERAAIAGGAALALACDLLVVGEGSFLHISEVELGRAAPVNVAWLTAKHTPALALEAVVAAPRYEARSMQAKGLAHLVVPDDDVLSATRSLADRLASFDRATVVALKDSLRAATGADFAAVLERVTRAAASVGSGEPGERS